MALYPYTLQPVALNLTEAEFSQAQQQLFDSNTGSLKHISPKMLGIAAAVIVVAIIGIILVHGYSTVIFWLMLVAAIGFLLLRQFGLPWYVKREYAKQMAQQTMPDEMKTLALGIQQHGLVLSMPASNVPAAPRGYNRPKVRATSQQQAIIKWQHVTHWQETPDFIFVRFNVQQQDGSLIVPKRLAHPSGQQKFPIDTLRHHLQEQVGLQGLDDNALSLNHQKPSN